MSRPWILGFVSCLILASSTLVCWGQEYLDLPEEPAGHSTSLADKLFSLKDKFTRKSSQPVESAQPSDSRSRPGVPRYRNNSGSSIRSHQRYTRETNTPSNDQVAPQTRSQTPQPRPTNSAATSRSQAPSYNSTIVARPQTKDLLPDTLLFSRSPISKLNKQTVTSTPIIQKSPSNQETTTATNLSKSTTKSTPTETSRVARRSPITSRANELDAALADLTAPQPTTTKPTTTKPSPKTPAFQPTAKEIATTSRPELEKSLDLRQALRGDKDTIAAEAASLAAKTADSIDEGKASVENTLVAPAPPKTAVAQQTPAESTKPVPPVVATAPKSDTKKTEASKQVAVDTTSESPEATQPAAPEAVVATKTQRDAITIATPRPSPPKTSSISPRVGNDPFESSANQSVGSTSSSTNPMRPFQPVIEQEKPVENFTQPSTGVLQASRQPVIVSRVEGPRSILVGQEATYQVTLENTSSTSASDIAAQITVPEWAELLDAMSTSGVVERSSEGANAGALEWKISELKPRASQALRLRLIPRSGRPLQLGVRWSQAPVQAQAVVEVQEPKLDLAISGPQEVRFGKPQRYRLTLSNPGTGTTEQVVLRLVPPGGDSQSATTQPIGSLEPGEVKDIDLELTAREAGELLIQADAVADGGLKAETTKSVLCLKPELKVDWRGPDRKYAGTVAAYYFRVSNPGTAETEPVDMSVKLPAGTEFVTASEGFSIDTSSGVVSWSLASLEAGEEQFMQLRCKIARPGINDFLISATTSDNELKDSKAFETDVVALADLKLEVRDPQGPLPLGEEVVYEIRVRNRGTTSAEHINIVGLFSEGIDPTTVEGAQYTVRDGRVSFHPIKSLPAGREVLLRIHAKAGQVGTHIFRTEVTCPKLDIKLAAEETTRFFEDEHRWEDGETPYMAEREDTLQR